MRKKASDGKQFFGEGLPYLPSGPWPGMLIVVEGTDGVGRSTQVTLLREWLEVQGYGVIETGWTRSKLIGNALTEAKKGHNLTRITHTLMYATDFADRQEYQILPALRNGFIVLGDRYVYTAFARAIVRGVGPDYVRDLFGFALVPDVVFYLRLSVPALIRRVLSCDRMNYWESGMDLNLGADLYDSFKKYQSRLVREFDKMSKEFGFITLDAHKKPHAIQEVLRQRVAALLEQRQMSPPGIEIDDADGASLTRVSNPG
ncbi:MAG: thymidylate kinase [Phycisphaerae bacterium]|nr:thymidylate kinase [Phycisphaerae bacterium]